MKIVFFYSWIIIGFMLPQYLVAQKAPVGILPMQYNPSFAGSAGSSRLVGNFSYSYRNYGNSLNYSDNDKNQEYSAALSYDTFIPKIRSGIGITASGLRGNHVYQSKSYDNQYGSLSLIIAPKISIKGKYTISPSFLINYEDINHDILVSSDGIWFQGYSGTAGVLFNASHYYIGLAIRVFRSGVYYPTLEEKLYSTIQMGYCFQKSDDARFSFTPQLVFSIANTSYIPEYTLGFRYDNYLFGAYNYDAWYPSGFQVGWQKNGWRIMICNIVKLGLGNNYPGYDADISLRYIFNQDKKSIHIMD